MRVLNFHCLPSKLFVILDLMGQVWQAFVGVKARRVERYYQDLLSIGSDNILDNEQNKGASEDYLQQNEVKKYDLPEKLKRQIEKVV